MRPSSNQVHLDFDAMVEWFLMLVMVTRLLLDDFDYYATIILNFL